jgi:hypothetical protein
MFVAFHVNAYFSLGGEVLLYFIVQVEVIEIINLIWNQIGLEFRKDLKNKKSFPIFLLAMGRNPPRQPNWACPGFSRVWPRSGPGLGHLLSHSGLQTKPGAPSLTKTQWKPVETESSLNWKAWR